MGDDRQVEALLAQERGDLPGACHAAVLSVLVVEDDLVDPIVAAEDLGVLGESQDRQRRMRQAVLDAAQEGQSQEAVAQEGGLQDDDASRGIVAAARPPIGGGEGADLGGHTPGGEGFQVAVDGVALQGGGGKAEGDEKASGEGVLSINGLVRDARQAPDQAGAQRGVEVEEMGEAARPDAAQRVAQAAEGDDLIDAGMPFQDGGVLGLDQDADMAARPMRREVVDDVPERGEPDDEYSLCQQYILPFHTRANPRVATLAYQRIRHDTFAMTLELCRMLRSTPRIRIWHSITNLLAGIYLYCAAENIG